jgi:hypothetical protein
VRERERKRMPYLKVLPYYAGVNVVKLLSSSSWPMQRQNKLERLSPQSVLMIALTGRSLAG